LDLNGDGLPDLVTGINGEAPIVLVNQTKPVNRPLRVFLRGPQGNPGAAGAKIRLDAPGLPRQTIEVHAGEGLLSSVSGEHILAAPPSSAVIKVTWPDGSASEQVVPADAVRLEIPFAAPAPPVPAPPAPAPAARAR
jgi:hypothetical protein